MNLLNIVLPFNLLTKYTRPNSVGIRNASPRSLVCDLEGTGACTEDRCLDWDALNRRHR